ncbi:WXG100 family type VII secretion target [Nocardia sp. SC052]|uniref:WXG100 family type VII secretion target n=1 Tax=Nocardia sichangensis TaxID=3385975 RepID=UPI0039A06223
MTSTREELIRQIEAIRSSKNDIGNLPQKVQDWHGDLVKLIRAEGYTGGLVTGGVFTTEMQVDLVWANRDQINKALGETWDKLAEMEPGLEVPVTFIDYANEWRNIRNDIFNASNAFSETDLTGEWEGDAANRYRELRMRQKLALDTMPQVCETIATSLERIAQNELALYTDLATKSKDLVTKVLTIVTSLIKSFFNFPLGPISASTDLVAAVDASKTFILGAATSIATNAQTNMIEGNKITQNISAQAGLPENKWPPGVVASYGEGINGLRIALGDASVNDGDKSDWKLQL